MNAANETELSHGDSPKLIELLLRWEQSKEAGHPLSAEEICQEYVELLGILKKKIAALEAVNSLLADTSSSRDLGRLTSVKGYTLLEECGRGGMGVVYQAFDNKRQIVVALKTLKRLNPSSLFRFKNEFRVIADLSHENLVGLHELAFDGESWFFTMDYVDGVDFRRYLRPFSSSFPSHSKSATAVSFDRLRKTLKQLADGVLALHDANILHRDLKPSNVLVKKNGRVQVVDFGLAAVMDGSGEHQSTKHHAIGTAAYMAPEQAAGKVVSRATDWYSIGVMLYEVLTGELPFTGNAIELLRAKTERDPIPPDNLNVKVPPDLNELCRGLLKREPQQRLNGADILRVLSPLNQVVPPVSLASSPPTAKFVGRRSHLEALQAAFERVACGGSSTVFVQGNSGVGKSTLVQRFLDDQLSRTDAVILSGRCYERESVPYKAFDSVIDALANFLHHLPALQTEALMPRDLFPLAQVFPELQRVRAIASRVRSPPSVPDAWELRRRAFAGLRELFGRLGERRPVVIFIDDLQWGDADSAALLVDLLRGPEPPSMLVLGAFRLEESAKSPFLKDWRTHSDLSVERCELTLEDLPPAEACELAGMLLEIGRSHDSSVIQAIARESNGNPFFIYELVDYVRNRDFRGKGHIAQSISLEEMLVNRFANLPPHARSLLEVVAVASRPISQTDACHAAEVPVGESSAGVLLRSGRLIRSTNPERDEIETYHDRVREVVAARLTPERLLKRHRGLVMALEASGETEPEVLAVHCYGAGDVPKAQHYYVRAADKAVQALAFDQAATFYGKAIELATDNDPAKQAVLHAYRADALASAGRGAQAAAEYLQASDVVDSRRELDLKGRAAMQLMISGHVDDGLRQLNTLFDSVGMKMPATPRRALLSLLLRRVQLAIRGLSFTPRDESSIPPSDLAKIDICWSAVSGLSNVDIVRGSDFQTRCLLMALKSGEPFRIARSLAVEGCLVSVTGGRSARRAAKLLEAADRLAKEVPQPYAAAFVSLAKGCTAFLSGHWRLATQHCAAAEAAFRNLQTGVWWELDTAHTYLMWSYQYSGRFNELSQRAPLLLKEALDRGDLYAAVNLNTQIMTVVRLVADQADNAREQLRKLRWAESGFHVQHLNTLFAHVKIDLYQGDGLTAWNRLVGNWPVIKRSLLMRIEMLRIDHRFHHAATALASARMVSLPNELLDAAQRDARLLERESRPWAGALGALVRAGVAAVQGNSERTVELLINAETLLEAADLRHHAIAARRRRGEIIAGDAGRALVDEADWMLRAQSVKNPARIAALLTPGFADATQR